MKKNRLRQIEYKDLKMSRTRFTQIIASITFFLYILPVSTRAQNDNYIQSNAFLAEKVYLQLDGKVYTTGNIVWFKSIVLSAYDHVPSSLSGVLYVELIGPDETILEKQLIKLENGIGQGFFYLDETLPEGLYLIRAYTQWNKNFETDFLFEEYIQVFAPNKVGEEEKPISNVTLINEQTKENHLEACFSPLVIDSLHKGRLTVIITLDDKKDTLLVRGERDNKYLIDYNIANENQFATLQMLTANEQRYSTTIVLNEEYLDLQFFPESGELVHGLQSKVGFKALDANGQGKMIQGDIIDEKDSVIASLKSNSLGMGSFLLNKADSTKTYYARLIYQSAENQILLYPLPGVASVGNILSVDKQGNSIQVATLSNYMRTDSIYLRISFRGESLYDLNLKLKEGRIRILIPGEILPEGIISFTMMDNSMRPVAERLYFNERPESRINIALSTNKNTYTKRELTNLEIETTDANGEPINANLSLLVINKQQMGEMQSMRQNILSYFLLDSELRGEIENPGFYFNKDSTMHSDLDALMLTQGWRKYHYAKPFQELNFQPEPSLSVTGHVSGIYSSKRRKSAELTMMTFGKNRSFYSQIADSMSRFKFILDDEYGKNVNVVIQSAKKSGRNVNYTVTIDKKESPPITYNHIKTVEKLDSVVNKFVEKDIERNIIDDAFPLQSGNILIEEVEITGYRLTPERKKFMKEYGEPSEIIDGNEIRAKEEKWSSGLFSVLRSNFPDKVRIYMRKTYVRIGEELVITILVPRAAVIGADATMIVVDGIPIRSPLEYDMVASIPPSDVKSVEIINCAKNWDELYYQATGRIPRASPHCGGVIAIYTAAGKGIVGVQRTVGMMLASVPVFSAPREFYAPKYENPQADDWNIPDLRALIHWEPVLKTDRLGNASVSFYNADNVGKMMVVVETISEDGKIGYQEIDYEIEGKEEKIFIIN